MSISRVESYTVVSSDPNTISGINTGNVTNVRMCVQEAGTQAYIYSTTEGWLKLFAESFSGIDTAPVLNNFGGKFYCQGTPWGGGTLNVNTTGSQLGCWARIKINCASLPTVNNATRISGSPFVPNADMYLLLLESGLGVEWWLESIALS
jgi:hypothetical protein